MSLITIVLFFVYIYGLGFSLTFFVKNSDDFLERNLMRIGIGLGIIPCLGIVFNILNISIDWKYFLIASMIVPLYYLANNFRKPHPRINLSIFNICLLLIFIFSSFMYIGGAFKYPYLEDDDPWAHAISIKYVATEKKIINPEGKDYFQYLDPYPPSYDLILGLLHQTGSSLSWVMKFFNGLIISLGIIFFYFFVKAFTKNKGIALFSTFILASIPSYLSHFIWAHSLAVTLFFPLIYCLEQIGYDKKWGYPSSLLFAGILLTQPDEAIKLSIFIFLYVLINSAYQKKVLASFIIPLAGGMLFSLLWWFTRWKKMFMFEVSHRVMQGDIDKAGFFSKIIINLKRAFPPGGGTATREYTFSDYFIAKSQNLINNPVGIGIVVSLLVLFVLIFIVLKWGAYNKQKKVWVGITLAWLLFTFIGMNSLTFNLPFGLIAFRFWMLFAIPVSILGGYAVWVILKLIGIKSPRIIKILVIIIIIFGIIFSSTYQKYKLNNAVWGPGGGWNSIEELKGYLWLKNLPANTKVFPFSSLHSPSHVIGMDKYTCYWCDKEQDFYLNVMNKTPEGINEWLKREKYDYMIIDQYYRFIRNENRSFTEIDLNESTKRINSIISSNFFVIAYQTKDVIVLKTV